MKKPSPGSILKIKQKKEMLVKDFFESSYLGGDRRWKEMKRRNILLSMWFIMR